MPYRRRKQLEGKMKRQKGLWTTVHGSQICGYVILGNHRLGKPCSQYATPSSRFCKRHATFQKEVEDELKRVNESLDEPIDFDKKYCLCNDTYQDGDFMIACDVCDDWFHGECVGISEEEGIKMEKYICRLCQECEM